MGRTLEGPNSSYPLSKTATYELGIKTNTHCAPEKRGESEVEVTSNGSAKSPTTQYTGCSIAQTTNTQSNGTSRRRASIRNLIDEELQEKYEKGLCFKCYEKYSPHHVCNNKQFHMMLVEVVVQKEEGVAPWRNKPKMHWEPGETTIF